jgi:hypothetical protein
MEVFSILNLGANTRREANRRKGILGLTAENTLGMEKEVSRIEVVVPQNAIKSNWAK